MALLAIGSGLAGAAGKLSSEPLFAATFHDLDNRAVNLAAWKGKPVIINFWARWCAPCRKEIPLLVDVQNRSRTTGVDVVGLNLESEAPPVRDFAQAYEVKYPVMLTREGGIPLMQALGNASAGLPFTVVLNRRGEIVASKLGAMSKAELDAASEAALK